MTDNRLPHPRLSGTLSYMAVIACMNYFKRIGLYLQACCVSIQNEPLKLNLSIHIYIYILIYTSNKRISALGFIVMAEWKGQGRDKTEPCQPEEPMDNGP